MNHLSQVFLVTVTSVWRAVAFAQQAEIDQPAGEVPSSEYEDQKAVSETSEKSPPQDSSIGLLQDAEISVDDASWDSYKERNKTLQKNPAKKIRVEDIVEPLSEYRYAAFGKGDPFIPPLMTEEVVSKVINAVEIPLLSPLQQFELRDLSLVGVWQLANGERKAMIMTPSGAADSTQGIIVRGGDPVGKRGGRILAIGDNFLTVREFQLGEDGTRQFSDQQMFMGQNPRSSHLGKIRFEPGAKDPEIISEKAEQSRLVPTKQNPQSKGVEQNNSHDVGGNQPGSAEEAGRNQVKVSSRLANANPAEAQAGNGVGNIPALPQSNVPGHTDSKPQPPPPGPKKF